VRELDWLGQLLVDPAGGAQRRRAGDFGFGGPEAGLRQQAVGVGACRRDVIPGALGLLGAAGLAGLATRLTGLPGLGAVGRRADADGGLGSGLAPAAAAAGSQEHRGQQGGDAGRPVVR
jgi:hypothetical protein